VAAEIGGVALTLQLATSINYLLFVPVVGLLVWIVIWRVNFQVLENVFGLGGLALIVTAVAVWQLGPDWGELAHEALHPSHPVTESIWNYWYYAIALFGAGLMPYEVFFFSSGAIEEKWRPSDLSVMRSNVFLGFPLGGMITVALMVGGALALGPAQIDVTALYQVGLPTSVAMGKVAFVVLLIGFFACTFGAALETAISCGYSVAQYLGWQWGKQVKPADDSRFHLVLLATVAVATAFVMTTIDPIKITEFVIVFSAAALPLTYIPVLIVANDPETMGEYANSKLANAFGTVFLVLVLLISVATIPLMIVTKAGG
jgi:Mn2+/Fe2+ NRAMP family transporter